MLFWLLWIKFDSVVPIIYFASLLERRIRTLVNLNVMQFGFMPGKRTVDAIFIVRKMQEEYQNKDKKLYMCFVDMEKNF